MPDLAVTDVTATQTSSVLSGRERRNEITLAFGDGVKTYPTGGVPLSLALLGLKRNVKSLDIVGQGGAALLFDWDKTNNKIRMFFPTQQTAGAGNRAGIEYTGATTAVGATTLTCYVIGW